MIVTVRGLSYSNVSLVSSGEPGTVQVHTWGELVSFLKALQRKFPKFSIRLLFPSPYSSAVFLANLEFLIIDFHTDIDELFVVNSLIRFIDSVNEELSPGSATDFLEYLGVDGNLDSFLGHPITFEVEDLTAEIFRVGGCHHRQDEKVSVITTLQYKIAIARLKSCKDNCLFTALRYLDNMLPNAGTMRRMVGYKGKVTAGDAISLCQLLNLNIQFLARHETSQELLPIGDRYEIDTLTPSILLHKDHYYPITSFHAVDTTLCQTCGSPDKCACSYMRYKQREKLESRRVDAFWDCETHRILCNGHNVNGKKFYQHGVVLLVIYIPSTNTTKVFKTTRNKKAIVDFMRYLDSSQPLRLYAHNGGSFDTLFVLHELLQSGLDCFIESDDIITKGSKIISFRHANHVFLDTINHVAGSLKSLGKSFNTRTRKMDTFEHQGRTFKSTDFFEMGLETDYQDLLEHFDELGITQHYVDYCIDDCRTLAEIWLKYKCSISDVLHGYLDKCEMKEKKTASMINNALTAPSLSLKLWRMSVIDDLEIFEYDSPQFKMIDDAIIGGISYIRERDHVENISCVDVVSLYVWSMISNEFPIGSAIETTCYIDGCLGVYHCSYVKCNNSTFADVPVRLDGRLCWKTMESKDRSLCSIDIDRIRRNGGVVIITHGLYWCETSFIFQKYLNPITNEKKRQDTLKGTEEYNEALRSTCKLLGNALYGKTMERKKKTEVFIAKSLYAIPFSNFSKCFITRVNNHFIIRRPSTKANQSAIQLGMFVLAYSRNLMMDFFDCIGRANVVATETDSIYLPVTLLPRLQRFIGTEIGQLDVEYPLIDEAYFLAKKAYALRVGDKYKYRLKGVPERYLHWDLYTNWHETGEYTVENISQFKRNLYTDASVVIGCIDKHLQ